MKLFEIFGTVDIQDNKASDKLKDIDSNAEKLGGKLDKVGGKVKSFGGNVSKAGTSMTKWATGPIMAVGAGMVGLATKTGNYADRILDLTDITGMSSDAIQEWAYVADIAGVSTDAVNKAAEGLVRRLPQLEAEGGKATDALGKLGLTYDEMQKMSPEEQIDKLIYSLSEMEDPLERNAVGSSLFGGAWKDLAPILGMGQDEIAKVRKEAHELGVVMDEDGLNTANGFRQSMERLKNEFGGLFRQLAVDVIPILVDDLLPIIRDSIVPMIGQFVEGLSKLAEWFGNLSPGMQEMIIKAIAIVAAIGPILVVVGKVISAVGTIISLFAKIAPLMKLVGAAFTFLTGPIGLAIAAVAAIIAIGVALWKNWDKVKEFAGALRDKLVEIFTAIKDIVIGIVKAFIEYKLNQFRMMRDLVVGIFNALKDLVVGIVTGLKNLVINIITALRDGAVNIFNSAKNGVVNVVNALKNGVVNIFNAIRTTASNIFNGIKNAITNIITTMKNSVMNTFNSLRSGVSTVFNNIKEAMLKPVRGAVDGIRKIVEKIKGLFKFDISFPDIKLPNVFGGGGGESGGGNNRFFANGGYMSSATEFARAGNTRMIGGEAGGEGIVPLEGRHMVPFAKTVADIVKKDSVNNGGGDINVNNEFNISSLVVREEADVKRIAEELERITHKKRRLKGAY